jgi:hypothetical protein
MDSIIKSRDFAFSKVLHSAGHPTELVQAAPFDRYSAWSPPLLARVSLVAALMLLAVLVDRRFFRKLNHRRGIGSSESVTAYHAF